MKALLISTALLLAASPALALNDTASNNTANDSTVVGVGNNNLGTINTGTINSGAGSGAIMGGGSASINVQRNPVSTAFAAPLVAADDTCMGSTSAGGQGVGFGLSLGSTWTDENCVRRKDARELHNMGYEKGAIALLCQSPQVRKAMKLAGTPCVGAEEDYATAASERPSYGNGSPARH